MLYSEKKLVRATNDYHKLDHAKNMMENKTYAVTVLNNKVTQNRFTAHHQENGVCDEKDPQATQKRMPYRQGASVTNLSLETGALGHANSLGLTRTGFNVESMPNLNSKQEKNGLDHHV